MSKETATIRAATAVHPVWLVFAALLVCLGWSYWPTLVELRTFWAHNEDYSVGQLVPLVALYLLWRDRVFLLAEPARPAWWGLGLIAVCEAVRLTSVYFGVASGERYALIGTAAGVVLLAAGWRVFWRVAWVLAFLVLMVPLPSRIHEAIALPLQQKATVLAVFVLELFGYFVVREGNVLRMDEQTSVAVTEACSGLRMLTAFIFVSVVLAFLVRRPAWHKVVLLACSFPIAVLSNVIRIVVTAMFVYHARDPSLGDRFHDAAGIAMMPLGLAMALGVLKFLAALSSADPRRAPARAGQAPATGPRRRA